MVWNSLVVYKSNISRSSKCPLTGFLWLLSHVIKSSQADKSIIRVSFFNFTKLHFWMIKVTVIQKNYLELGNLAKLMFWLILSFKNLQVKKVNIFLSFSGKKLIWENREHSFCRKFRSQLLRDKKRSSATHHSAFGKRHSYNTLVSLR